MEPHRNGHARSKRILSGWLGHELGNLSVDGQIQHGSPGSSLAITELQGSYGLATVYNLVSTVDRPRG
jgi:hypothetical protein